MQKVLLWGTGQIAGQVLEQCGVMERYDVIGFVDNNTKKQGTVFLGKPVFGPQVLSEKEFDGIFVLVDKYQEIVCQIKESLGEDARVFVENYKYFYKQSLLKRYEACEDAQIQAMLTRIREKDLQVFNYDFADKYEEIKTDVEYDSRCGLYYVWHRGKESGRKLYFARHLDSAEKVEQYYRSLLVEQDIQSPHRYLTDTFDVKEGDVVVDAGVAEGNFALDVIERASKIYLIEADEKWIEALEETFREDREKIVILPRYLTSMTEGQCATLDSLINEPVNFIKMDIEGNEWDALLGAAETIRNSQDLKCAVCCYHADFDEILIRDALGGYGMQCSVTPGFMWFPFPRRKSYVSTKFSRGIVRGIKGRV